MLKRETIIARLRPGSNRCQCAGCGELFGSVGSFDSNRVGKHGVDRHCLTPFEMRRRELRQIPGGWWVRGRMGRDCLQRVRRSGDRPSALLAARGAP